MPEQLDANQRFAVRVRRLREKKGWTRAALARRARVNPSYLRSIEMGEVNTSLDKGAQIAAALGVPLEDMIKPLRRIGGRDIT